MTWDMPSDKTCPKCSSFVTQKTKGNIITYKCSNTECDYLEEEQKQGKGKGKSTSKSKA
jgi:hypothetical protein